MNHSVDQFADGYDLIVVGSGAGGLAAAVTAGALGLRVLVLEKDAVLGGISAWSGGWLWVPGNHLARVEGIDDSPDAARRYLLHELGSACDPALVDAYLAAAPAMLEFFERIDALAYQSGSAFPDYHPETAGGVNGGRSLRIAPLDARSLGVHARRVRPLLPALTFLGLGIASGSELRHFSNATRSIASAWFVLRRLLEHGWDCLRHGRGMHLVNGNALVGRLLRAALRTGVDLRESCPVHSLIMDGAGVSGVRVRVAGMLREVRASRGVVLACGGIGHDLELQRLHYPHVAAGAVHLPVAPASISGDGIRLGVAVGGMLVTGLNPAAILTPVSRLPGTGVYPHFVDRGKPGIIAVDPRGRRFVNEANSYHDFTQAMIAACAGLEEVCAWLICDTRALRRYGLGYAKPFPVPHGGLLRSGYLHRGVTLRALAVRIGLDGATLEATVRHFNDLARAGHDSDFDRGGNSYNHFQGDAGLQPNPCLAPLEDGPWYAVKVVPGDLGAAAGLSADGQGRVLDSSGRPIAGLYAAGNDMATVMRGRAPGGGVTLGPALTFGYLAARHAAGRVI